MKIKSSTGNIYYDVDLKNLSCSCPDYKFRKIKTGEFCKHINEALNQTSKQVSKKATKTSMLKFIKNNNMAVDFIEMFSEISLNFLKRCGDVYESNGKIIRL